MDQDGLQRLPPNPLAFDTRNFADLVGLRLHLKALYAACDTDGTCVKPLYAEKVSIILDVTHSSPFDVVTESVSPPSNDCMASTKSRKGILHHCCPGSVDILPEPVVNQNLQH